MSSRADFFDYIDNLNSVIFGFTEALHFNSKFFDSPKEFRPERFLSDIGKFDPPKEGFLPFGIEKHFLKMEYSNIG
ncbi:hypothetical protein Avbf_14812 [Armadillidium vulgare]|nr:hypothetical protein Avbf_14812 [Armadillidium vulgare]